MVQGCSADLRMVYVGKRSSNRLPSGTAKKLGELVRSGRVLEVDRADFGVLFREMDLFVVHGGLGTTVEALRMRKPTCVTGPLLLDQRWWGDLCFQKGIGPPPVTAAAFVGKCAAFAEGALHPDDPHGWQAAAARLDWGASSNDGVEDNVAHFERLLGADLVQSVDTSASPRLPEDVSDDMQNQEVYSPKPECQQVLGFDQQVEADDNMQNQEVHSPKPECQQVLGFDQQLDADGVQVDTTSKKAVRFCGIFGGC